MIHWWILPLVASLFAAGMTAYVARSPSTRPYGSLLAFGFSVVASIICAVVWGAAFIAKVATP